MLHGALLCATAADILTVVALREYICAKEGNHTTCGTRPWPASVSWAEIAAQRAQQKKRVATMLIMNARMNMIVICGHTSPSGSQRSRLVAPSPQFPNVGGLPVTMANPKHKYTKPDKL